MELINKTIIHAEIKSINNSDEFDDSPYLYLKMSDGTEFTIVSNYGGYSGESEDEYPRFIEVVKGNINNSDEEYKARKESNYIELH